MKSSSRPLALLALALCLPVVLPVGALALPIRFAAEGSGVFHTAQSTVRLAGGGFAVVWNWWAGYGPPEERDVRLQMIRPDGSLVFPRAGRQVAATAWSEDLPAVVAHPEAGVFVAWVRSDWTGNRVWVQRFDAAGQPLWSGGGVLAAPMHAVEHQGAPYLLPDADGGVYACFQGGSWWILELPKVVCQRLDAEGRRLWPDRGIGTGGTRGLSGSPQLVADGEGGILVFWRNDREVDEGALGPVLFEGQRFAPDGSPLWGPQGRVVGRSRIGRYDAFIDTWYKAVSDGEGGAVLAFQDQTGPDYRSEIVSAQRVDGDGRPLWGSGVTVGPIQRRQVFGDAVAGPDGGVFVALLEGKIPKVELSVYRLGADGATLWRSPVSRGDQTFASASVHGDFDGELLRIVWESYPHLGIEMAEIRLSTLDAEGRLAGPTEVLSPLGAFKHPADLVYDPVAGQGLALWNAGMRAVGVLFE